MRILCSFLLFFAFFLESQSEVAPVKVTQVLEFDAFKYYRLAVSASKICPAQEYSGLVSNINISEYETIVPNQQLSGDFAQFHRHQPLSLTSPREQPLSLQILKLRLVNPLYLEIKTLFALLQTIGQTQSEILFQFLEPLKNISNRLAKLEQILDTQIHPDGGLLQKDILVLWQDFEVLTKEIESVVSQASLESQLSLLQSFSCQLQEKKQVYTQLAQNEYLLQDYDGRHSFLVPFKDRGNAMIVAEIQQIEQKKTPLLLEYSKQKEAFFQKQGAWGNEFFRTILTFQKTQQQQRLQQIFARQQELEKSKAERDQLTQQLTQCDLAKKEFFEIQQEVQKTEYLSSEMLSIQGKRESIEKAKKSLLSIQEELKTLETAEELLQKALAELARCEQTQHELNQLEPERLRLQKEIEPLSLPQTEKIQNLEVQIQEKKMAKATREALREKEDTLRHHWSQWNQQMQHWETQQKPLWETTREKQKQLEFEKQQLPLADYQEIPAQLEKLTLAKNRLPIIEQEIERCNTQKQRLQETTPEFERNREKMVQEQQKLQNIQKNKGALEQELSQLQKTLTLSQQNQQEIKRFFSAYLKEIETLREQYKQIIQEKPLPLITSNEIPLPEEIRVTSLKKTNALLYEVMALYLAEAFYHRLFLLSHPYLQEQDLKIFSKSYEEELQKIKHLQTYVNQKQKTIETINEEADSLKIPPITAETWDKVFLEYAPIRQEIQGKIQIKSREYIQQREALVTSCPEATQEVTREILDFFHQATPLPILVLDQNTFSNLDTFFDASVVQLQTEILQKQKELDQTFQEFANLSQTRQDLLQKRIQKNYIFELIRFDEKSQQEHLNRLQQQQEKLQQEHETLLLAIQLFPQLEQERDALSKQLSVESSLQEKEKQRQQLLQQEKQLTQQILECQATLQSLQEAYQNYLKQQEQTTSMKAIAEEIQHIQNQLDQIPQMEAEIKQAEQQIEELRQEIKIAQDEWQKKQNQLKQIEEKRRLLQQILEQEQSWKEQRQHLETQIQRKNQLNHELTQQEKMVREEPQTLLQQETLQKQIQIRETQLKRLETLKITFSEEKELRARFDSYANTEALLSEILQQRQTAQQELERISEQIAQIPH